jgi:hypothetical protein
MRRLKTPSGVLLRSHGLPTIFASAKILEFLFSIF